MFAAKPAKQEAMLMKAMKQGPKAMKKVSTKEAQKAQKKAMLKKQKAQKASAAAKKGARTKWLNSAEMQKKHVVPFCTKGVDEVTFETCMADRLQEKKLPQHRATCMNLPMKLGSTKGFVHWKIDHRHLIAKRGSDMESRRRPCPPMAKRTLARQRPQTHSR